MDEKDLTQTSLGLFDDLTRESATPVPGRRVLTAQEEQAIAQLPAGSALLIALAGSDDGSRYLLNSELANAGRHPRADIFLDDKTVSRRHAQFVRRDGAFFVRDSGSLNGTYVNRERVSEVALHNGDEVQIGKFRLTFFVGRGQV